MVKIDTLFQTKTAKKNRTLWRRTYLYIAYMRDYPLPPSPLGLFTNLFLACSQASFFQPYRRSSHETLVTKGKTRLLKVFYLLLKAIRER